MKLGRVHSHTLHFTLATSLDEWPRAPSTHTLVKFPFLIAVLQDAQAREGVEEASATRQHTKHSQMRHDFIGESKRGEPSPSPGHPSSNSEHCTPKPPKDKLKP